MNENPVKIFFLKKKVLFPHCNLSVRMRKSRQTANLSTGDSILVFSLRNITDILLIRKRISTLAEITAIEQDGKFLKFQIKGIKRVKIARLRHFFEGFFNEIPDEPVHDPLLSKELRKKSQELIFLINVEESDRLIELMNFLIDPGQISDFIANYFVLDDSMRNSLLNETDIKRRSRLLLRKIQQIIDKIGKQG